MQSRLFLRTLVGASAVVTLFLGGTQLAAAAPTQSAGVANFRGTKLDLTKDWGQAQSCVVVSKQKVQCFTTNAEADAYAASIDPVAAKSPFIEYETTMSASGDVVTYAAFDCASGWLCLYDGTGGTGRRLIFRDDYWQELSVYGFEAKTSSWRNRQNDNGYLQRWRSDSAFSYPCAKGTRASSMGAYDNWALWVSA